VEIVGDCYLPVGPPAGAIAIAIGIAIGIGIGGGVGRVGEDGFGLTIQRWSLVRRGGDTGGTCGWGVSGGIFKRHSASGVGQVGGVGVGSGVGSGVGHAAARIGRE
jgi:hypothetical protein